MFMSSRDGFRSHNSTAEMKHSINEYENGSSKIQSVPVTPDPPQEGDVMVFRDGQWQPAQDLGSVMTLAQNCK